MTLNILPMFMKRRATVVRLVMGLIGIALLLTLLSREKVPHMVAVCARQDGAASITSRFLPSTASSSSQLTCPAQQRACQCRMIAHDGHLSCARESAGASDSKADTYIREAMVFAQTFVPREASGLEPEPTSIVHYTRVCPQSFRNMADMVLGWDADHHGELFANPPPADVVDCLPEGAIVYVSVGWVDYFFRKIYPLLRRPIVLVTGNGDESVPEEKHHRFLTDPTSKIAWWFGQNGDVDGLAAAGRNHRFTALPIGLNCFEMSSHMDRVREAYIAARDTLLTVEERAVVKSLQVGDPARIFGTGAPWSMSMSGKNEEHDQPLLLVNFDATTDTTGLRKRLRSMACEPNGAWSSFSACHTKQSGVQQYAPFMVEIYQRNLHYPFWLSPRGNGFDCHRTWEALYFGRIPIISSTPFDHLFQDLPVIIIPSASGGSDDMDGWSVITADWLRARWVEVQAKRKAGAYRWEKLTVPYWRDQILNKSRTLRGLQEEERPARWWVPLQK